MIEISYELELLLYFICGIFSGILLEKFLSKY